MNKKWKIGLTTLFLAAQVVLYYFILTDQTANLHWYEFGAIVLCAVFAACFIRGGDRWILGGLLCTVGADYFLVARWPEALQLWGMVCFLGAQTLYAIRLYRIKPNRALLLIRIGIVAAAELITALVLGDKTDALALVSLAYYAMLIMNIVAAFADFRHNRVFAVALVLFLLCDTVVGLQVAAGGYLPIAEGSLLHKLIFSGFNLAWLFYLPSQVLIALCAGKIGNKT